MGFKELFKFYTGKKTETEEEIKNEAETLIKTETQTKAEAEIEIDVKAESETEFKKYLENNKILKLQLGAGHMHLDGWFNTDLCPDRENGIYFLDMLNQFDFEDSVFDFIYSEHNVEHFELEELYKILKECIRVLKPNGVIRLATPDLKKMINMYLGNDEINDRYCEWETNCFIPFAKEVNIYSRAIVFSNFFRCWGHKVIYDYETLSKILEDAGFRDIKRLNINESDYPELVNVESHWKVMGRDFYEIETMILEAKK